MVLARQAGYTAAGVVADIGTGEESTGFPGCVVREASQLGNRLRSDLDATPASPIFSGDKAEFFLANVECTIYPEGVDKGEQVARLQRAMEALEAQL